MDSMDAPMDGGMDRFHEHVKAGDSRPPCATFYNKTQPNTRCRYWVRNVRTWRIQNARQ
jgi:hypothetical protein